MINYWLLGAGCRPGLGDGCSWLQVQKARAAQLGLTRSCLAGSFLISPATPPASDPCRLPKALGSIGWRGSLRLYPQIRRSRPPVLSFRPEPSVVSAPSSRHQHPKILPTIVSLDCHRRCRFRRRCRAVEIYTPFPTATTFVFPALTLVSPLTHIPSFAKQEKPGDRFAPPVLRRQPAIVSRGTTFPSLSVTRHHHDCGRPSRISLPHIVLAIRCGDGNTRRLDYSTRSTCRGGPADCSTSTINTRATATSTPPLPTITMKTASSSILAAAAVLLASLAHADPVADAAPAPSAALSTDTFEGCYSSAGALTYNNRYTYQTSGWCQGQCVNDANYAVMATTNSTDCYCGNTLPPQSDKVDNSNCNLHCAGYASEMCM